MVMVLGLEEDEDDIVFLNRLTWYSMQYPTCIAALAGDGGDADAEESLVREKYRSHVCHNDDIPNKCFLITWTKASGCGGCLYRIV